MYELSEWVDGLNRIQIGSGHKFQIYRDRKGTLGVGLTLTDGLVTVKTAIIGFMLDDPATTQAKILGRLKAEFLACWEEIWEKATAPDKWTGDGSPVELTEEIHIDEVMRI